MFKYLLIKKYISIISIASVLISFTNVTGEEITGIITDASTGEPVYMVSVYLKNTTLGDATDKTGKYIITDVAPGHYEIIVSMIGYSLLKKRIQVNVTEKNIVNFEIKPEPLQAPTLKVEAERPKKWLKNLDKFTMAFLGETPNAKKCKINYTEHLSFNYNDINHILTASSNHPLEIINQGLGYKLTVDLIDFKFNELTRNIRYEYSARFQPLEPMNEKEKNQWEQRRTKAYYGSKQHFMRSLHSDSFEEEGFQINSALTMYIGDNPSKKELTSHDILSSDNMLSFPEYLEVIYKGEIIPRGYKKYLKKQGIEQPEYYQYSWLQLNNNSKVIVNKNGSIYDPHNSLTVYGYWIWERVADSLPLNYTPEN
ncbi:MAG: carboxypeptidase-like regulatory domain-containing protein [bacterium]